MVHLESSRRAYHVLTIRVFTILALTATASAQCALEWGSAGSFPGVRSARTATLWDPDGPGPLGDALVIGGFFSEAGPTIAHSVAMLDLASDTWSEVGVGFAVGPNRFTVLGNGDLVAAGNIPDRVQRFDGTSWNTIGAGVPGGNIHDVEALPGSGLVAGGSIQTIGGLAANHIATWDGTNWAPLGTGTNGNIYSVTVLGNGDILAAGTFDLAGAVACDNIARWNGTAWSPLGPGLNGRVDDVLEMPNGDLIATGQFTAAGTTPIVGVAHWDGTSWSQFGNGQLPGGLRLFRTTTGDVWVGGLYPTTGYVAARWNGANWTTTGSTELWIGQDFVETPTGDLLLFSNSWAPLRWTGTDWERYSPGTDGWAYAMASLSDGTTVAAGDFTEVGGVRANFIALFDGTSWSALGAGVDRPIHHITVLPDDSIVVAGEFTSAGTVTANGIARWDGNSWSALGSGMDGEIHDLVTMPDGSVVAGGDFRHADGVWAPFLARWDGAVWSNLGSWPNWHVFALTVAQNGDLVVGGNFGQAGGNTAQRVARWDGNSWHQLPGLRPFGFVAELACMPNGDIIAAGTMQQSGPNPLSRIARWDGSSWTAMNGGLDGTPNALLPLPNGDLIASGWFGTANIGHGNTAVQGTARWDGTAWSPIGVATNGPIHSLHLRPDGQILASGEFERAGGALAAHMATIESTCPATVSELPTTCAGTAGPVTLSTNRLPWTGTTWSSNAAGFSPGSLAIALLGLTSPDVPLSWIWSNTLPGCRQLASQEAILLTPLQGGASGFSFVVPNDPVFAGVQLFHQFLQFEINGQGQLGALSASNGLELVIGAL